MSFVSARELEAAREQRKREAKEMREEVLREAKESFEKQRKREELKRARGEDTWIVPAVKKRLGFKGEASHSSEKKKRKKKKEKKHKKHKVSSKVEKNQNESESGSNESEGEEMWAETGNSAPSTNEIETSSSGVSNAEAPPPPAKLQRDEWMTMPLGASDRSLSLLAERRSGAEQEQLKQREKEEEANYLDKPGQHPRELNPFWKDGGEGLPSTSNETESTAPPSSTPRARESSSSSSRSKKSLGDGGHSWLVRAYKRALEQARESGRTLEDVAIERWGSLDKLHSLLNAAGIDPDDPDAPPRGRTKREYLYSRARRLDEDSERRSVEEFDRRRERGWERRRDQDERDGERGRGEGERRGGDRRDRHRKEKREAYEYRRQEGDIEKRKRDWKQGFQKPHQEISTSDDRGEFLKPGDLSVSDGHSDFLRPGDLNQGPHSRSTGIRTGLTTPSSSGGGWRKKKSAPEISAEASTDSVSRSSPLPELEATPEQYSPPAQERSQVSEIAEQMRSMPVAVPDEPVTEALLNSLGAKLMKAELVGNQEKVEKLKKELERLREVKRLQESSGGPSTDAPSSRTVREEKTLVLTKTDRFGREKPVQLPSTSQGYRPQPKRATHTKKGKREKYFHDDDRYSLKELVEQERMMTAEETHAAIARMASKFVPATGSDETVDDAFDSKSAMKHDEAKELEKAKKRSVTESRKMADAIDKCQLCFDSPNFSKHLLVAVGMNAYLCAPWHTSLTKGHCYIVPMEHVTCSLFLDENIWSEMEIFRKGLTRMFADHDLDVVFMETFTSVKRKTHMYIDCIPIPRSEGELAPMYFKKAILESDEEWAQNKKLIDTREKGVRGSLPTGLPYFFAEFGLDGGFGHVIEDTDQFPHYFGREVVGGLLDLSPRLWLKPHREDFEKQRQKVVQLSEWWAPYDWTQKLKQTAE